MAVKPKIVTLTNASMDILNAIRNNASTNFRDYVPVATADVESLRTIGAVIMDNPNLQNEFLHALYNRIGKVIVLSKTYQNPWAMFKKGMLEFGETIEEIFVEIAKPFTYDAEVAENTVFKREIPDVRSAFHVMNYQKFYKVTLQNNDLRKAFMSWQGVTDFIARLVQSLYTAANYDEFQTMKYMLAKTILNGMIKPVQIEDIAPANMNSIVSTIKETSNNLEYLSGDNNIAGVKTLTMKNDQYLIINSKFDAMMDVEVLASAFNMGKAEFYGHRVPVDSFGSLDIERLNELFAGDSTYVEISADELSQLNEIPAVLVDREWFMIFDNLVEFTEQFNGEGLYWNEWYHVWKTFSISPFANAKLFVAGNPTVSSVVVSPASATVGVNASIALTAAVTTENFAPQTVVWSADSEFVSVNADGVVKILPTATAESSITVTATSTYDNTVKGTCEITVA